MIGKCTHALGVILDAIKKPSFYSRETNTTTTYDEDANRDAEVLLQLGLSNLQEEDANKDTEGRKLEVKERRRRLSERRKERIDSPVM